MLQIPDRRMQQAELSVHKQDNVGNGEKGTEVYCQANLKKKGKKDNFTGKPTKSNTGDKKFNGKSDTRNNNSKELGTSVTSQVTATCEYSRQYDQRADKC